MYVLIAGLALFLIPHSARIVAPQWCGRMHTRLGENGWKGLYSLVSLVGLVLIVWGYGLSRLDPVILYSPPVWMRHITLVLMMPVFVMLAAAYIPGRIKSTLKHPMLAAVKLWALVHLLANGDLASMLLFAAFLAFAVVDVISAKKRATAPVRPRVNPMLDVLTVIIGLVAYMGLMHAHGHLFGVPVIA